MNPARDGSIQRAVGRHSRFWARRVKHVCEGAYWKSCGVSCFQRYGEKAEPLAVETRQSGKVLDDQDAASQESGMCRTFRIHVGDLEGSLAIVMPTGSCMRHVRPNAGRELYRLPGLGLEAAAASGRRANARWRAVRVSDWLGLTARFGVKLTTEYAWRQRPDRDTPCGELWHERLSHRSGALRPSATYQCPLKCRRR